MNTDYESLPNFLKNLNSVLDDSDANTEWHKGSKPDYSLVNGLFDRGKPASTWILVGVE